MLFLDFLLLVMIIVCITYCWVLNRRIQDLQNSRIEFARMIKELNASIVKAETNVHEMSELGKITSTQIKAVVDEARESINELTAISQVAAEISAALNEQTKNLVNKLEKEQDYVYENIISSKSGERFSEEDLAPSTHNPPNNDGYTNNFKNFIQNMITRKVDVGQTLNQMNYYDTLRKINAKKTH